MTAKEFSDQFDVLYNNITSNQAPGLNEYEKSVFLTKAQDEIVKNYFLAEANPKGKGFDDTHKRQMDFSMLMSVSNPEYFDSGSKLDPRGKVYKWSDNILYVINESFDVGNYSSGFTTHALRQVVALSYGEYMRLMSKPYKGPLKYQAWRLITGQNNSQVTVEIILNNQDLITIGSDVEQIPRYTIRYVRKPQPILLTDLSNAFGENLTIDNKSGSTTTTRETVTGTMSESEGTITISTGTGTGTYSITIYKQDTDNYDFNRPCELHPSIHQEILQRAVELAKIAWAGDQEQIAAVNMATTAGQRSE